MKSANYIFGQIGAMIASTLNEIETLVGDEEVLNDMVVKIKELSIRGNYSLHFNFI